MRTVLVLSLGVVLTQAVDADLIDHHVVSTDTEYRGRPAIRVVEAEATTEEDKVVILADSEMQNGTISGFVAGARRADAAAQARGFVGIAFRIDSAVESFEAMYLRPTNARANDQLRRNHSVQYISFPDHPWHRLRRETPGKYESYADMGPGEWVPFRLEIDGASARLFLNEASQPTLIVNDLRLEPRSGRVGLWIGPGTEAHFAEIRVEPH